MNIKFRAWEKKRMYNEDREKFEVELNDKIEAMRDLPPPYPADEKNPMKHIYQNEGYAKALEDILSTE